MSVLLVKQTAMAATIRENPHGAYDVETYHELKAGALVLVLNHARILKEGFIKGWFIKVSPEDVGAEYFLCLFPSGAIGIIHRDNCLPIDDVLCPSAQMVVVSSPAELHCASTAD